MLRLLSRLLRVEPIASSTVVAATQAVPSQLPVAVPLPAGDSEAVMSHAQRYFSYGEDLSLRGAPELAAPFYRQAYALLAAAERRPAAASTASAAPPATLAQRWHARLPQLRQQLDGHTAPSVLRELQQFRQDGLQDPELWNLEGLAELQLQRSEEAERCFRQALALQSDHYKALVNLGGVMTARNADEAVTLLRQALALVPANSEAALPALTNLAAAQQQAGRVMEAALLVHQVHQLKPGHLRPARLRQAAQTLEQMGEDQRAIHLLSWLADQHPEAELLQQLAELLERRGELEQAALIYRRLDRALAAGAPVPHAPASTPA